MAKLKPISISFDEYQLSKNYFEFNVNKKEVESAIYNILFNRKYYQMYYEIIIKYLLHKEKISPSLILDVVRKHAVLLFYYIMKGRFGYDLVIEEFDKLLSFRFTSKDLLNARIENNHPLALIFNKENGKEYEDYLKLLEKELSFLKENSKPGKSPVDVILTVLRKDYLFFSLTHKSLSNLKTETDKKRSFDQLISENIEKYNFIKFNLQIDLENINNYCLNFNEENNKVLMERYSIVFGVFVYEVIKNDNLNLVKEVDLQELKKLNFFAKHHKILLSCLKFINSETGAVDKQTIIPFKFVYNDILYEISKEGIKKSY